MQDSNNPYNPAFQERLPLSKSGRSKWWYLLVLVPLAGLIYPPFYARMYPMLFGVVPFFIWYQFAWIFGGIVITLVVSKLTD